MKRNLFYLLWMGILILLSCTNSVENLKESPELTSQSSDVHFVNQTQVENLLKNTSFKEAYGTLRIVYKFTH